MNKKLQITTDTIQNKEHNVASTFFIEKFCLLNNKVERSKYSGIVVKKKLMNLKKKFRNLLAILYSSHILLHAEKEIIPLSAIGAKIVFTDLLRSKNSGSEKITKTNRSHFELRKV